jgi:hypothetical protein
MIEAGGTGGRRELVEQIRIASHQLAQNKCEACNKLLLLCDAQSDRLEKDP